ncbi:hypothetical protein C8R46DRAFT_1188539 [Mycena filopes]|nr:hypothetical protein C8R46DRAFT_1188539 [Mycena filopes]
MPPIDATSPATFWGSLIPGPAAKVLAAVVFILISASCILRLMVPTRRMAAMEESLREMKRCYRALLERYLDLHVEAHRVIWEKYVALEYNARVLRIEVLNLQSDRLPGFWWWNELFAINLSRRILECTVDIDNLKTRIQLVTENAQHQRNRSATVELVLLRHRQNTR